MAAMRRTASLRTVPVLVARTHLGRLIDGVAEAGEQYIVTRRGTPTAVILGVDEYEDLLSPHPMLLRDLRRSRREIAKGMLSSLRRLRAMHKGRA
ncbi:MAG: type II toxin-antitoxin system Phd/YefM family antitoxin [Armatimonadetes bacterium]|nr:type II toxin-antitoxin system Phd/YefM family antitoxin [Armatimonadota bacterium]